MERTTWDGSEARFMLLLLLSPSLLALVAPTPPKTRAAMHNPTECVGR